MNGIVDFLLWQSIWYGLLCIGCMPFVLAVILGHMILIWWCSVIAGIGLPYWSTIKVFGRSDTNFVCGIWINVISWECEWFDISAFGMH